MSVVHDIQLTASKMNIVFLQIASCIEQFSPLYSFRRLERKLFKFSLHKGKNITTTILKIQKRIVSVEKKIF